MRYLNDTCVFLHKIINNESFFDIVGHINKCHDMFSVTDIVFEEIKPGTLLNQESCKVSNQLCNCIEQYKKQNYIEFIEICKNGSYKKNYDEIRKRYYGHLYDRKNLIELVKSGKYTKDEVKRLKYKDRGECSCLAVAIENPEFYTIISDDNGLITLKPDTNIFKIYEQKHKIKIYKYETWIELIKYNKRRNKYK